MLQLQLELVRTCSRKAVLVVHVLQSPITEHALIDAQRLEGPVYPGPDKLSVGECASQTSGLEMTNR